MVTKKTGEAETSDQNSAKQWMPRTNWPPFEQLRANWTIFLFLLFSMEWPCAHCICHLPSVSAAVSAHFFRSSRMCSTFSQSTIEWQSLSANASERCFASNRVGSIRPDDLFKCRVFIETVTAPSRNRPIYSSNAHTDWNRFAPFGTCQFAENACACVHLTSQFHSAGPTSQNTPSQILFYNRAGRRFVSVIYCGQFCVSKSAFNAMHQFCGAPPIHCWGSRVQFSHRHRTRRREFNKYFTRVDRESVVDGRLVQHMVVHPGPVRKKWNKNFQKTRTYDVPHQEVTAKCLGTSKKNINDTERNSCRQHSSQQRLETPVKQFMHCAWTYDSQEFAGVLPHCCVMIHRLFVCISCDHRSSAAAVGSDKAKCLIIIIAAVISFIRSLNSSQLRIPFTLWRPFSFDLISMSMCPNCPMNFDCPSLASTVPSPSKNRFTACIACNGFAERFQLIIHTDQFSIEIPRPAIDVTHHFIPRNSSWSLSTCFTYKMSHNGEVGCLCSSFISICLAFLLQFTWNVLFFFF